MSMLHHCAQSVNVAAPSVQLDSTFGAQSAPNVRTVDQRRAATERIPLRELHRRQHSDATFDKVRALFDHLRRGGAWSFTQGIGDHRVSNWIPSGAPFAYPKAWHGQLNIYWGVNPASTPVTDDDRENYAGWTDARIMPKVGSKNATISAVNTFIAEFDGKDYTDPTDEEIAAAYQAVKAEMEARLLSGELTRPTPEKGIYNQAVNRAQDIKYKIDPAHYKALALAHVQSLTPAPSVTVASGGGYQCYWLLDVPFIIQSDEDRANIADLYKRWNDFTGGDPACKDLRRVLRIPGTLNVKPKYAPDYPLCDFVWCEMERTYTLDQIKATLPAAAPAEAAHRQPSHRLPRAKLHRTHAEAAPTQPLSKFVVRVAMAYNANHTITDELRAVGYIDAGHNRMRRPDGQSASVQINPHKGGSYHHSSSDPLFGQHLQRAFDVRRVYDFDGDPEAAAEALAPALGILSPAALANAIASARRLIVVGDWSSYSTSDRTSDTDRKLFGLLINHMERLGKVTGVRLTHRQLLTAKDSDDHEVLAASTSTVSKWIERMNGKLISVDTNEGDTEYTLNVDFVVSKSNTTCIVDTDTVVFDLLTTNYQAYKADDAYQARATAPDVREAIGAKKAQLCAENPHFQAAAIAHHEALASKPTTAAEWRALVGDDNYSAYKELVRLAAEDFLPTLSTEAILVLAYVIDQPGSNRRDIADALNLKPSTVAGILRKLEAWAAIDSDRATSRSAKTYEAAPDAFGYVKELTPSCRSFRAGVTRYERALEKAQFYADRQARDATADETARRIAAKRAQRAAAKRFDAIRIIHPNWTDAQVKEHIYAPTAMHRPWVDRRIQLQEAAQRMAEQEAERQAMQATIDDLRRQGRKGAAAYSDALFAGWTASEAAKIAAIASGKAATL